METQTAAVTLLQAMEDLVHAGDLEGVLTHFTDDAVVRNLPLPDPPETNIQSGKQAIRAWLEPQLQRHLHVTSQNYQVAGDTVTFNSTITDDELQTMGIDSLDTTVEMIVQRGKIASFDVTFTPDSIRKYEEAEGQAGASA